MEVKKPELVDAWSMSITHRKTFEIPGNDEISMLLPGNMIKVCASGERFWCEILSIDNIGFVGKIDNDLIKTEVHGLSIGDLIFIAPNNIYQIYEER